MLGGLPPLQSVIYAGVGFVGTPILEGTLSSFLPVSITANTIGKYAVRIASVLGLSFVAKMALGRGAARMVGIGGGAYVLTTAVREFAPGLIPGMSAYTVPGTMSGMRSYIPAGNLRGLSAGSPFAMGSQIAQTGGGQAARFRRF